MLRNGECINLYGENLEYDAYIIFGECADRITAEDNDTIEKALTPVLEKTNWSKNKRKAKCEKILESLEEKIENLGWGYDVIVVK